MEKKKKECWHIVEATTHNKTVIWDDNGERVAIIDEFPKGIKSNLIAAAPDILEALEDLMAFVIKHVDVADCQEYNHAHRIIAKALTTPH